MELSCEELVFVSTGFLGDRVLCFPSSLEVERLLFNGSIKYEEMIILDDGIRCQRGFQCCGFWRLDGSRFGGSRPTLGIKTTTG